MGDRCQIDAISGRTHVHDIGKLEGATGAGSGDCQHASRAAYTGPTPWLGPESSERAADESP